MPPGRYILDTDVNGLWFNVWFYPCYGAVFVGVTFAGRSDDPVWYLWAGRAFLFLFWWVLGSVSAAMSLAELHRREQWVLPGVLRRPWLMPAAYEGAMLLTATVVLVGVMACITLISAAMP